MSQNRKGTGACMAEQQETNRLLEEILLQLKKIKRILKDDD